MRKRTADVLIELGVPANLKGFHYICDAMEIYAQDEFYITSKKVALYQKIAGKHNTSWTGVERCIRSAFEKAVTYGNLDSLNKYMTSAQKPTNGNLLACLYLKLKDWPETEMSPRAGTRKAQYA
ncbi:MAG: sporulation initiation factor Spo0A C-terminal domain-containing protein [Eubacteriales bacterium]|nr:sporulation initiation factor Spo0A C-terminal domain-containing protein [Eubacteriales bacterium]